MTYVHSQQTQNICITHIQCWTNVEDVGPTLLVRQQNAQYWPDPKFSDIPYLTFSHTAAILDSKMVSIIVFSNYGDVKQIYMNKIGQTYIVTRHIN